MEDRESVVAPEAVVDDVEISEIVVPREQIRHLVHRDGRVIGHADDAEAVARGSHLAGRERAVVADDRTVVERRIVVRRDIRVGLIDPVVLNRDLDAFARIVVPGRVDVDPAQAPLQREEIVARQRTEHVEMGCRRGRSAMPIRYEVVERRGAGEIVVGLEGDVARARDRDVGVVRRANRHQLQLVVIRIEVVGQERRRRCMAAACHRAERPGFIIGDRSLIGPVEMDRRVVEDELADAGQSVGAVVAVGHVEVGDGRGGGVAEDQIVRRVTREERRVVSPAAGDVVVAGASGQPIVAGTADQRIVAPGAIQNDNIGAVRGVESVVAVVAVGFLDRGGGEVEGHAAGVGDVHGIGSRYRRRPRRRRRR